MFCRPSPMFSVKVLQKFGPNVVKFKMVTGERLWYIVVCYLDPDDASTIESVTAALGERLHGSKLTLTGYFNADLTGLEGVERDRDCIFLRGGGFRGYVGALSSAATPLAPRRENVEHGMDG